MMDRFKFKIVVYERNYEPKTDWKFAEIMEDNNNWHLTMCGDIKSNNCYPAHYRRDNAPNNVCRVYEPVFCTGLKDKNGKLIYEGDIVFKKGNKFNGEKYNSKVIFDEMYAAFNISDINGIHQMPTNSNNIEVIGNIYENPELLKEIKED